MAENNMLETIVSIAGQLDPSLQKAISGAAKQFGTVKKAAAVVGTVTVAGMAAVTTATVAATTELYKLGVEFDGAVDTIRIGTGATGEALDDLYADMKEVYKNVPTTLEDASSAIADYNTRLGLTGEPLQELSQQAIQVSDMLGEGLSETIEKSSKAFEQWNIDTEDMSDQMDYIFKVSQSTGTGFNVLMGDMQSYGAQLQELGFDFNEASVLIGQMDKAGVNVNEVLGAMKKSVSSLAAEGVSASEGLEQYYTEILNAKDATEATAIASEVFGTKSASTMAAAIREGSLSVGDLTDSLLASEETINTAATDTYDFAEQFQLLKQNAQVALEPIASEIFNLANEIMPYLQDGMEQVLPIFSEFGEILIPILQDLAAELFPVITGALVEFGGIAKDILPFVAETISQVSSIAGVLLPILMNIAVAVMPIIADVLSVIFEIIAQVMPIIAELAENLFPVFEQIFDDVVSLFQEIAPVIADFARSLLPAIGQLLIGITPIFQVLADALQPIFSMIGQLVVNLLPALTTVINLLVPVINLVSQIFANSLGNVMSLILPIIQNITNAFVSLCDFISNVFTGNWSAAWESIQSIFKNVFEAIVGLAKMPINGVIAIINGVINGINGLGFTIPDWVPVLGGKDFSLNIPLIPMLETGGFTDGPSIAGEAGMEAVISFDSAYRDENLSYWAKAGRMLGVDDSFLNTIESGASSSGSQITLNVTYSPEVNVTGTSRDNVKNDVIAALKEQEEEFMDMLEDTLRRLEGGSYSFG